MASFEFLRPIDQFDGSRRLLNELIAGLQSDKYQHFRVATAFAKSGPLLRLSKELKHWRTSGRTLEGIFGIDHRGTTSQALELALNLFDTTYICHTSASSTFHPKIYLSWGDNAALCIFGSHNLTVGGTETNLEGAIKIEFEVPADNAEFDAALSCWTSLLPENFGLTKILTKTLLNALQRAGLVSDENRLRLTATETTSAASESELFPNTHPKPPSAIPKKVFEEITTIKEQTRDQSLAGSSALVIQIVPHHNGEVFLSKLAVNQNPDFFGFPFTGRTVPKKASNPSYPQRLPDPLVSVIVYDASEVVVLDKNNFPLNTVFYEKKSEIRITFPPDFVGVVDQFAVMVMQLAEDAHDYLIEVFNPGSQAYDDYLSVCDQSLPSGGAARARKMGWL